MAEVTIEVDVRLLPQLVVLSAITQSPAGGGPFIENHCCMAKDADELSAEIENWKGQIEGDNYKIINMVVRIVPREVYQK